jgi:DNA-binding NarL/FixJ family response regulator
MSKFLIADDHPLFREALIGALKPRFDNLQIAESDSLETTLAALQQSGDIDLILLDLTMPGCENFYGVIKVVQEYPELPVAVVSASDSLAVISQVMTFGARAFIPKSTASQSIADAIDLVLQGERWLPEGVEVNLEAVTHEQQEIAEKVSELTPKQFQVLKLLQEGLLNKQIAYDLSVTEATVKAHISAIFKKFGVNTRTQAVLLVEKLHHDL